MLPDSELEELAESIKQNGQRQPIVLTEDGLILDGRNRAKACEMVNVEPEVTVYDGDDLAEYVIDANSARRHMPSGQRYMCDALVWRVEGRRLDGRCVSWNITLDSSPKSACEQKGINSAGFVLDHAPDLADLVASGEMELGVAVR